MRKNSGPKPWLYPIPVLIIGTYDENGVPNAMNAAWGMISDVDKVTICLDAKHKTTKNILSIVAICGALPISKEMVGVIMSFKRKPLDKQLYEQISERAGDLEQIYELLFTTQEKSYVVEAAIVEGKDVICYTLDPKCDVMALQKHLQRMLDANGYKENVKVFKDLKKFLDRVSDLERREKVEIPYTPHSTYPDLNRDQLIKHTLLALSI